MNLFMRGMRLNNSNNHPNCIIAETVPKEEASVVETETPISRMMSKSKTHARSASHGGVQGTTWSGSTKPSGNLNWAMPSTALARPSALKKPGHQRAHSHGQVVEVQRGHQPVTGHSRVGSKTDFILPPGHREEPPSSRAPTAKVPSFRGHSRQASR